jgi:hypothetical protein
VKTTRKSKEGYCYVGDMLRDELISAIDALGWEGEDAPRAAKVKSALQLAAPHRGGYLFDVHGWDWQDYDFLKTILVDSVEEDLGHTATSRGIGLGNTPIGRQIRALREKL